MRILPLNRTTTPKKTEGKMALVVVRIWIDSPENSGRFLDSSRIILVVLERVDTLVAPVLGSVVDAFGERIEPGIDGHERAPSSLES